ncbi:DUF4886 domain-containing protein [Acholeplasma granularum]|uniref:DUF4886 domain-containing protein n=1 Tax=Acholeplasma granularum TaxID=264635 RepID=UPI00046F9E12|nr:DUF4886 domain-containing protein [Acholeplasma granularum]
MKKEFKLLSIGNSFSEDAHRYAYDILKSIGYENIIIANLYIGGASLKLHDEQISLNLNNYIFQIYDNNGYLETSNYSVKQAINYDGWHFITVQQSSYDSGVISSYEPYLTNIIKYIQSNIKNNNYKLYFHMTWPYEDDAQHPGFTNYNNDRRKMFENIIDTYQKVIKINKNINGFIPNTVSIENARTNKVFLPLTRDGYHLSLNLGRYIASLTLIGALLDVDIRDFKDLYKPNELTTKACEYAINCAHHALKKPLNITMINL